MRRNYYDIVKQVLFHCFVASLSCTTVYAIGIAIGYLFPLHWCWDSVLRLSVVVTWVLIELFVVAIAAFAAWKMLKGEDDGHQE
jgi:hypothetical protein